MRGVSRGSGVFFGRKRQRFLQSNSAKKTPDPSIQPSVDFNDCNDARNTIAAAEETLSSSFAERSSGTGGTNARKVSETRSTFLFCASFQMLNLESPNIAQQADPATVCPCNVSHPTI